MKKTKKNNKHIVKKKNTTIKRKKQTNKKKRCNKIKRSNKYIKGGENLKNTDIINIVPILNNYSTIYIAIGGKYIQDNYPISLNTGAYQLAPQFILDEASKNLHLKTLIIIIDLFNDEEYEINNNLIKENLKNTNTFSNVDYIFINNAFDKSICNELKNLIDKLNTQQKIYIANYVYYFSPNLTENNNKIEVDNLLKELLNFLVVKCGVLNEKNLPENKNIYKWLGSIDPNYISKLYLYDIIYNSWVGAIKKNNTKQIEFNNNNSLRITPDYE